MQAAPCAVDLSTAPDERLVVLAQGQKSRPARDELILRHHGRMAALIARSTAQWHLAAADREDLHQDAVFWILEAVQRYDAQHPERRNGCSFRSFLHLVVASRLTDSLRRLRRLRSEVHCAASQEELTSDGVRADQDGDGSGPARSSSPDPAASVERKEEMAILRIAFERLDSAARRLWSLMAQGMSLRGIAEQTGMSYDMVKRRRRKLICQLRIKLKARPGKSVRVTIARRNKNR